MGLFKKKKEATTLPAVAEETNVPSPFVVTEQPKPEVQQIVTVFRKAHNRNVFDKEVNAYIGMGYFINKIEVVPAHDRNHETMLFAVMEKRK